MGPFGAVGRKAFTPESVPIKKEPCVKQEFPPSLSSVPIKKEHVIKSEFQPSLSSIPLTPPTTAKKEPAADSKPDLHLASIPENRKQRNRNRRRRWGGDTLFHRVDGYQITAHYSYGMVSLRVTKTTDTTRELDWSAIEKEIFRKLHNARFFIEPTGPIQEESFRQLQSLHVAPPDTVVRASLLVRNIPAETKPAVSPESPVLGKAQHSDIKDEEEKDPGLTKPMLPVRTRLAVSTTWSSSLAALTSASGSSEDPDAQITPRGGGGQPFK